MENEILEKCTHADVFYLPYGVVCRQHAQAEWCGECGQMTVFHENGVTILNPKKPKFLTKRERQELGGAMAKWESALLRIRNRTNEDPLSINKDLALRIAEDYIRNLERAIQ